MKWFRRYSQIVVCTILFHTGSVQAQLGFSFNDVSTERGIGPYVFADGIGAGVAAADFDDDGFVDLFVPNGKLVRDQLYRNLGDGSFEEIAIAAGLASTENNQAGLWFDYDADHDLDLLVTNFNEAAPTSYRLYRQFSPAQFQDVTLTSGLSGGNGAHRGGSCAGDINNDGYLDLLTLPWGGEADLFLNNQDGTFTDISDSSGVGQTVLAYWQPMMADLNGDGWLDIYVAVDVAPNILWVNQQDNTFIDVAAAAGVDMAMNDMGLTMGDYDGDGDLDMYATNIFGAPCCGRNVLLRNDSVDGSLIFSEVSEAAGVDDGAWGWGATFMDGDNDGLLDLAATNGYTDPPYSLDQSRFFRNLGGASPSFESVGVEVGFNDAYWGSGLVSFDADRDGDLDMLQICADGFARLLDNRLVAGPNTNYLVVQPRMDGPNHHAIGGLVRIAIGDSRQMRLISAGSSFMSQEPAEAWFGTGAATMIDQLTIEWPDATLTVLENVCANQVLEVHPGDSAVIPYATGLSLDGPATVQAGSKFKFSAQAARCDGSNEDVTATAAWELTAGGAYATLIAPGELDVAELIDSQLLTLKATYQGFESLFVVLAQPADIPPGEDQPPLLEILSPTTTSFSTGESTLEITGTASDDLGLLSIAWSNDRGGAGPCAGLLQWGTGPIALLSGMNTISIEAVDTGGNRSTLLVAVERTDTDEPLPPSPPDNDAPPIGTEPEVNDNAGDAAANDNLSTSDPTNENHASGVVDEPGDLENLNEAGVVEQPSDSPSRGSGTAGVCGSLAMIQMLMLGVGLMFIRTSIRHGR